MELQGGPWGSMGGHRAAWGAMGHMEADGGPCRPMGDGGPWNPMGTHQILYRMGPSTSNFDENGKVESPHYEQKKKLDVLVQHCQIAGQIMKQSGMQRMIIII